MALLDLALWFWTNLLQLSSCHGQSCRLLSNEEIFVNISRKIKTAEQHSILVLLLLLNTPKLDEIKMSHVTSEFLLHNFHTVH
jgi:hypothetical protein